MRRARSAGLGERMARPTASSVRSASRRNRTGGAVVAHHPVGGEATSHAFADLAGGPTPPVRTAHLRVVGD